MAIKKEEKTTKKKTTKTVNRVKVDKPVVKKVEDKVEVQTKKDEPVTFNLIEVIIIMIITAVFGLLVGSTVTFFKTNVLKTKSNPEKFDEFLEVYDELMENYYEDLDGDQLIEAGIKGMMDYLDDNYSEYLDQQETDDLLEQLEGSFTGLGVVITTNEAGESYIITVLKNSPAERAKFEVGDVFVEVDGTDVIGMNQEELTGLIKGAAGTKCTVKVRRNNEIKELTFTRGTVEIPSVESELREGNIGYITIELFAKNTREQLETEITNLIEQGAEYFVLDVRNNSGGLLTSAEEISSLFLEKGDIIYQLSEHGEVTSIKNTSDKRYSLKMAILINGNSASGAEIFAAALNENLGVPLVGTKTFGKGTVQVTKNLSNGSMIKYTVQEWLTPNGNHINKAGINPTYYIEYNGTSDNQYAKAVDILTK